MPTIDELLEEDKVSRITEFEKPRYIGFYGFTYLDDLETCQHLLDKSPRWSIISGYYAMHDATKLFLVKNFGFKVEDIDVHRTTIDLLAIVLRESHEELVSMFESGYEEYKNMVGELQGARGERRKAQYYTTGSDISQNYFRMRSHKFYEEKVMPYIEKINILGDAI